MNEVTPQNIIKNESPQPSPVSQVEVTIPSLPQTTEHFDSKNPTHVESLKKHFEIHHPGVTDLTDSLKSFADTEHPQPDFSKGEVASSNELDKFEPITLKDLQEVLKAAKFKDLDFSELEKDTSEMDINNLPFRLIIDKTGMLAPVILDKEMANLSEEEIQSRISEAHKARALARDLEEKNEQRKVREKLRTEKRIRALVIVLSNQAEFRLRHSKLGTNPSGIEEKVFNLMKMQAQEGKVIDESMVSNTVDSIVAQELYKSQNTSTQQPIAA